MQKWFKRLYIPFLLLVVTIGVFSILKFGYTPAPQRIMKPSFFDNTEAIGTTVLRRFYSDISTNNVVAFGIPPQPEWHLGVVRGFLLAAREQKQGFNAIIAERQMPDLNLEGLSEVEVIKLPTNSPTAAEVIDTLNRLTSENKRVLLYLPSVFSTHTLAGNVIDRVEKGYGKPIFTVTSAPLSLRQNQEYIVDPPCVGSERDVNGTSNFGCAILQGGRMHYRKRVSQERWVAIMSSPKPLDYLLMISTPGQGSDATEKNHELRMNPPEPSRI